MYPFKDLQVTERIAEGFVKAGLPGESSGFYKISAENRLSGNDIREQFFGRKVIGVNMVTEKPWWIDELKKLRALKGLESEYPRMIEASVGVIQNASYLTEEQKRDILYNNAARFLRIDEIPMEGGR